MSDPAGEASGAAEKRRALVNELRAIEREWSRVRAGLAALGPGERLPGLHLVVGVPGGRALLPGSRIAEIARIVALEHVPGQPPWVLGSFVWRGRPAVAADLGARLGGAPTSSIDAILVILDGTPTLALVVEEVHGLAEDPLLADGVASEETRTPLLVAACRVADEALPVIAPEVLEREVQERT